MRHPIPISQIMEGLIDKSTPFHPQTTNSNVVSPIDNMSSTQSQDTVIYPVSPVNSRTDLQPKDTSFNLISPFESPKSPPHSRREPSCSSITFADQIPPSMSPSPQHQEFEFENLHKRSQGLGISSRPMSISRVPVGARSTRSPPTPSKPIFSTSTSATDSPYNPSNPFLSPDPSSGHRQRTYSFDRGDISVVREDEQDISTGKNTPSPQVFLSPSAMDMDSSESVRQLESEDGCSEHTKSEHPEGCPSRYDIHQSRKSWLSITILILSIYSTVFSGLWLMIAFIQPRYGGRIQSEGSLTPETASVLFALFAKTIELSFVSVFVAFLGQVLSRRSLVKNSRGVTIAELSMRTWILQPAVMITHFASLKHAGLSVLGFITLINAFVAMFYTTASDSLVSPHLKYGGWKDTVMYGTVKTIYANPNYVKDLCHNPTAKLDLEYGGTSCLAILHAGQAHSNHIQFLDQWNSIANKGEGIKDPNNRPQAPATLADNTNVTGSWISKEWSNMTSSYQSYSRIIDNVTMAMPHAGIYKAARDKINGILQPENLNGVGEYKIRAAVISPAINVLCVNMNTTELAPLVYVTWPHAHTKNSTIPGQKVPSSIYGPEIIPAPGKTYLNHTIVDDIFEWGPTYGRQPPVFPMYPIEYNSILNVSVPFGEHSDSIYVLFKAPNVITADYTLCKLRSVLSPKCSTHYEVSGTTGGKLSSNCENKTEDMSYDISVTDAPTNIQKDWMNIGSEVLRALALGVGIDNANASSSRLISQLITGMPAFGSPKLNPLMPSIAESLAVMAGSSLLLSSTDATFYHYWDFLSTIVEETQLPFNASIISQEYTSGYIQRWTTLFYLVLIIVFVTNIFCLIYFFIRSGLVTDFSEPQNLFALAVNSPPSQRLYGSCGAGPEKSQFEIDWHIYQEEASGHYFVKEGEKPLRGNRKGIFGNRKKPLRSQSSYSKLSSKRTSWL